VECFKWPALWCRARSLFAQACGRFQTREKGASDCPLCGGTMRVIADITDPDIIQKILDHIEAQPPPNKPVTAIQS